MSDVSKSNSVQLASNQMNSIQAKPLSERKNKITDEKLREVSEMYEKHFIREMMKEMRSTVHEGGMIKKNNAEQIFQDQLDDQYAGDWGKAGGIGLADMIHDQLIQRYGEQLGLKPKVDKPHGPIDFNLKSNITSVRLPSEVGSDVTHLKIQADPNSLIKTTAVQNPWAGTLLDKKYLEMDQMQYRIKHDNGLESLIMARGSGLPDSAEGGKLSAGDQIKTGQQLGWMNSASPLFWTIKPNKVSVSE
ncbi:MAG: rod-binding protein [Pseudobdellovibrio sp.]